MKREQINLYLGKYVEIIFYNGTKMHKSDPTRGILRSFNINDYKYSKFSFGITQGDDLYILEDAKNKYKRSEIFRSTQIKQITEL